MTKAEIMDNAVFFSNEPEGGLSFDVWEVTEFAKGVLEYIKGEVDTAVESLGE